MVTTRAGVAQVTGVSEFGVDAAVRDGLGQAAALGLLPAAARSCYRITRVASAVVAGAAWYYVDLEFSAELSAELAAA